MAVIVFSVNAVLLNAVIDFLLNTMFIMVVMDHTDLAQIERDRKIIADLGGSSKVAELLGFPKAGGQQRVQNWMARGIPAAVKVKWPDLFLKDVSLMQTEPKAAAIETIAKNAEKPEPEIHDSHVKLPLPASTAVADSLELQERRVGPPTRRLKQQPFTGPDKRVGPDDRRGFKLPEMATVLPEGL